MSDGSDRRRYRRLNAPVYCRPAGFLDKLRHPVRDVGFGGARIYSDAPFRQGERLMIDLVLPEGEPVSCLAEVAWVTELPAGSPAVFEIGLNFVDLTAPDLERLRAVLEPPG